jgi:hypothetical protein
MDAKQGLAVILRDARKSALLRIKSALLRIRPEIYFTTSNARTTNEVLFSLYCVAIDVIRTWDIRAVQRTPCAPL